MAENPDDSAGDSEMARTDAANRDGSEAVSSNLPMVVAPKLGAGEEEADETPGETAAIRRSRRRRRTGAFLALSGARGFGRLCRGVRLVRRLGVGLRPCALSCIRRRRAPAWRRRADAMRELKLELSDLAAIKANLDTASRGATSQLAKLADRLDRLDQHAGAAAETTGSIATAPPPPPAPAPKLTDRILPDWVVQDVQGGRALVESRYGGVFDVGDGSILPGVGRVELDQAPGRPVARADRARHHHVGR